MSKIYLVNRKFAILNGDYYEGHEFKPVMAFRSKEQAEVGLKALAERLKAEKIVAKEKYDAKIAESGTYEQYIATAEEFISEADYYGSDIQILYTTLKHHSLERIKNSDQTVFFNISEVYLIEHED